MRSRYAARSSALEQRLWSSPSSLQASAVLMACGGLKLVLPGRERLPLTRTLRRAWVCACTDEKVPR